MYKKYNKECREDFRIFANAKINNNSITRRFQNTISYENEKQLYLLTAHEGGVILSRII